MNTGRPFFSIVTPVYNAAPYIRTTMESVASQTFGSWEMIIVDDGSTDGSAGIARETAARLGDGKFRIETSGCNSGSDFAPRARAMRLARGEYIVNIDADDSVGHDYLELLADRIRETGADIVYARMQRMDGEGRLTPFLPTEGYIRKHGLKRVVSGREMMRHALGRWEVTGVGATRRVVALRSLENFGDLMRNPAGSDGFDNENLTRLDLHIADRVTFCRAVYRYRCVETSITGSVSPRWFDILHADAMLAPFISDKYGRGSEEYALACVQLFHHIFDAMRMVNRCPALVRDSHAGEAMRRGLAVLDRDTVRHHVSPRYFALLSLPQGIARKILKTYDRLTGK